MTIRRLVAAVLACTLAAACTHGTASPTASAGATGATEFNGPVQLTGAEQRFGTPITPQAGAVYQPDVVFVGGGADVVKSVDEDGLVWTIDGNAPGVSQLAVGKVMLATSLGAGRVLALGSAGPDVRVVLGPVQLTDVYEHADLGSSTPIPVRDMYAYPIPAGDLGSQVTTPSDHATKSVSERRLAGPAAPHAAPAAAPSAPPAPSTAPVVPIPITPSVPPTVTSAGFHLSPFWNDKGLGVHIAYKHQDGVFDADLALHMDAPSTTFHIGIDKGRIVDATVGLKGAASISIDVQAASKSTAGSFKTKELPIPLKVIIPLGGPLTLSLTQTFELSMQFLGTASITSHGKYTVRGDLGFGYRNGKIFGGSVAEAISEPITSHTLALGVAATSFEVTWSPKVSVQIGLVVFGGGLFYTLDLKVAVTGETGLDVLHPGCVQDSLVLSSYYGYGWWVNGVVMNVVNSLISIFGAKKLPDHGGRRWGPTVLWKPTPGNWCPQ